MPSEITESHFLLITVIVPMRNEEKNVRNLIASLQQQKYPSSRLQVILVDDHSHDGTLDMLKRFAGDFTIISGAESFGKKGAIGAAVQQAKGDVIVTTDADCTHAPGWLESINRQFQQEAVQLVVGGVRIKATTFFENLQALEFTSLIGSGAALLHFGIPAMANGANLSFRKSAFVAVHGYDGNSHIASGDDEFLLKKIHAKCPRGVVFNSDSKSVVQTLPQRPLTQFVQQRLRWASKWKFDQTPATRWVGLCVVLLQLSFLVCLVSAFLGHGDLPKWILLGKVALDGILLWKVSIFLGSRFSFPAFIMLEALYPFYVLTIGIWAQFSSYEWKGRRY